MEPRIRVSAILRWKGRVLLCRHEKPGKEYWLLPGGGVNPGESLIDALRRELAEEIGMDAPGVADLKTVVTEACMNVVVHAYGGDPGPLSVEAYPDEEQPPGSWWLPAAYGGQLGLVVGDGVEIARRLRRSDGRHLEGLHGHREQQLRTATAFTQRHRGHRVHGGIPLWPSVPPVVYLACFSPTRAAACDPSDASLTRPKDFCPRALRRWRQCSA